MTKLVEVALPLEEISAASRRDKDRKTGTIKNVHKWFAPMPTPAWRALLFASLVDDPGDEDARHELLEFVKELVPADGTAPSQDVLDKALRLIKESMGEDLPTVYDPFCGGGSTLVEAQRLGLPAAGSDLNPVPVLITRTLTELVPRVSGRPALMGDPAQLKGMAGGPLDGFLADCRYYAERVRQEVWDEIGHLYPPAPGGGTVIAWLWARTVTCPNPACRATAPLVSSFWLSKKKGALAWIEPIPNGPGQPVTFTVRRGESGGPATAGTKVGRGGKFACPTCHQAIPEPYLKEAGTGVGLGKQLMAVVAELDRKRRYISPADIDPPVEPSEQPDVPAVEVPDDTRVFWGKLYGDTTFADGFVNRQLYMLGEYAAKASQVQRWVVGDGGDEDYAVAIASIIGIGVSKLAMNHSTQSRLEPQSGTSNGGIHPAFSRQALPLVWDFSELNPFSGAAGEWRSQVDATLRALKSLPIGRDPAKVFQSDARAGGSDVGKSFMLATDPPYFAQIGYADLSDFFYMWLRPSLREAHPDLFRTIATPKAPELIAAPYRHDGSKKLATEYFVDGFTEVFHNLLANAHPDLPMLVVYAHRQEESSDDSVSSTAWDAMLTAILDADLRIVGTWPIHATTSNRQIGQGTNALASYVVLVCRPQMEAARIVDLPEFRGALRAELPRSIEKLKKADVSAIDLGQACIGPGMEVFSRYAKVIEPQSGGPMSVRAALELISLVRSEYIDEFASEMDRHTRWAMAWFKEFRFEPGAFGVAEGLFKETNTSLEGLRNAGILESQRGGEVSLIDKHALPKDWSPDRDREVTVWEVTNHLAARLLDGGEQAAAELMAKCGRWAADARDLAYWLSDTAATKGWTAEALDYDALVTSWTQIDSLAQKSIGGVQGRLVE